MAVTSRGSTEFYGGLTSVNNKKSETFVGVSLDN
jgi:hypothetical protein